MKPFEKREYKEYAKCPEGQHIARLVGLIDEGTQAIDYAGETKYRPKIYLQFEIYPEGDDGEVETQPNGELFLIGQDFSANLSDKGKLLPFINSWRGKPLGEEDFPFDFSRMLGKFCLMTVVHNKSKDGSKSYANINSIAPVPKKLAQDSKGESILPLSSTKPFFFDLDNQDWGAMSELMQSRMWDGIRAKICESPEYLARIGVKISSKKTEDDDDGIPF